MEPKRDWKYFLRITGLIIFWGLLCFVIYYYIWGIGISKAQGKELSSKFPIQIENKRVEPLKKQQT
ncbi:hypothetical protein SAMN05444392_105175 [Seinonella peptonophila]|uniref:Uncharacterized protein n=1 Tax=Seinonella peptonophila TaxID=112248 RepID=A0A1M4XTN9_9BACL|nr:hypothetical protein [Seinonella peptonophila]SHE96808.1 hypothetical protein SAMN05444392_105175 [Seinonella peptonophila]